MTWDTSLTPPDALDRCAGGSGAWESPQSRVSGRCPRPRGSRPRPQHLCCAGSHRVDPLLAAPMLRVPASWILPSMDAIILSLETVMIITTRHEIIDNQNR